MGPPFHARVRYTEPMVRRAARTLLKRRLRRRSWRYGVALGLLPVSLWLLWDEDVPYLVAGVAGLLAAVLLLAVVLWRAHFVDIVQHFRKLDPPAADVTLDDGAITVRSNLGSATLPWARFTGAWELPDCWMLLLGPGQFITVPRGELSAEAEAFLTARVRPG